MYKYILKRLLTLIPVILGVILIIFLIMDLTPGDPARLVLGNMASEEALESFRQEQGLNDPLPIRYGRYVLNICRGDLGASYKTGRSVLTELLDRFPASMLLAASSIMFALVISVPLSFFGGIGGASRSGILVKGGNYLEALSAARTVVFDKTGTLTQGVFAVAETCPAEGIRAEALLETAALAECYSSHPISLSLRQSAGIDGDGGRVSGVEEIAVCELTSLDVVRHPLVQKIVQAYDNYEQSTARRSTRKDAYDNQRRR